MIVVYAGRDRVSRERERVESSHFYHYMYVSSVHSPAVARCKAHGGTQPGDSQLNTEVSSSQGRPAQSAQAVWSSTSQPEFGCTNTSSAPRCRNTHDTAHPKNPIKQTRQLGKELDGNQHGDGNDDPAPNMTRGHTREKDSHRHHPRHLTSPQRRRRPRRHLIHQRRLVFR